ncbi:endonuclease III [Hippea maritima]|uniref:Endonuclease III n=1 Tax=Hippea maritima (strain ATCC 700847 / DSM 10411 / MH2) TaxID=760142 RepID=F2LXC4_HIPMA|nr:endonuclease III [Hippea maritima]AEA34238.1 endonuclease III [Hippea maritima DSM 10411]
MNQILERIKKHYPQPKLELNFSTPFELLVALVLSARCTDKLTNKITPKLFEIFPTPEALKEADYDELNELISSCSMHNTKAKNLIAIAKALCEYHNCKVPESLEELTKLPGIGRKTANIILSFGFGIPAVGVDTHVLRMANRLGISDSKKADVVEEEIKQKIPKEDWIVFYSGLILHGRHICKAKKPNCDECFLNDICPKIGVK